MALPVFVGHRGGLIGRPATSRHFRCQDAPTGSRLQPNAFSDVDEINQTG
jgi:hypothetical protein